MLRLLFKDHKIWSPSDGTPPPTRPVCAANSGMNVHFSDLLSMILEPLASTIPGTWEVISVDDFISGCEDYNEEVDIKEKELRAAGGAGVTEAEVEAGGGRQPQINREIINLPPPTLKRQEEQEKQKQKKRQER